jgi:site-specific recombinase XerD
VARVDQPARAPRALGEDEARRLLRAARRTGSTRGRALLALLSGTGLRLAEAAALDVDDVPTTERTGAEHVRAGKGERPRTVPLPADARSLLRCWLTERARHPAALRGEPALWLGRRGRLSARQLQRIFAELDADARLVDVSAHTLRHTAATRWLRAGVRRGPGRRSTWSRFPRHDSDGRIAHRPGAGRRGRGRRGRVTGLAEIRDNLPPRPRRRSRA